METIIVLFTVIMVLPICILIFGSFSGEDELILKLGPVMGAGKGYAQMTLLPQYPTLKAYVKILLDTPEFFVMFWNSVKITIGILVGQLLFGTLAAWGFAKERFPFRKGLLWLYIVLMLMPFQVLMLSDYLVLKQLNLLDRILGLVLQGSFSTFPVFVIYLFFCGIPDEVIEAAKIDGANKWKVFFYIGLPIGKNGIFSALILGLLESWGMIEQPMTFLKTKSLWPLSILLPEIQTGSIGFAFGVSVLTFLPALLMFLKGVNEKTMNRWVKKISIGFLAGMIAFTFLSRASASATTAVVSTTKVMSGNVGQAGQENGQSERYDMLVPLDAVYADCDGAYVLVVKEKPGILGTVLEAQKVDVEIMDKNGSYAAISAADISGQDIIIRSDREVKDGSRVRKKVS